MRTSGRSLKEFRDNVQVGLRWNSWTVTLLACACVTVAILIGSAATANISFDNTIDIIGHRGAGGVAPENTRAAIEQAISACPSETFAYCNG